MSNGHNIKKVRPLASYKDNNTEKMDKEVLIEATKRPRVLNKNIKENDAQVLKESHMIDENTIDSDVKTIDKTAKRGLKIQSGLCSREIFRIIIERERSRADRNGHELCFILFDFSEEPHDRPISVLVKALKSRSRILDKFGWYDEERIGMILPNTSYKGGTKFAHDICKIIIKKGKTPPEFKTYSYPSKWIYDKIQKANRYRRSIKKDVPKFIDGVNLVFAKRIPTWKRLTDIIGSLIALIIASPLFIIVPVFIKIVSQGPVFFKQERVGYCGAIFTLLKFRTMRPNITPDLHRNHLSDLMKSEKPMTKLDKYNDPRIVPLGKLLRKTSVDELPQLINVLKGEMSLVGPRPCLPYTAKEYLKWHKYRFDIKPGMTGLWQVSGKNRLTFKEMIRLDILYSKKMRFWLDVWILIKTIPAVVSMTIDKFAIESFFNKIEKEQIPEERFKQFIKRYYSDIYNVDKLEFLDDKLKNYNVDLMELTILLSKLNKISPHYNVAKRYFGICKLIDYEKRSKSYKGGNTIIS